ncbi:MAG TPA: hypothetical protein VFJ90_02620 [Candidatus Didemnitutus sp.]|nr:hypothetical protein [Candidatus Didemnitutus sp.]
MKRKIFNRTGTRFTSIKSRARAGFRSARGALRSASSLTLSPRLAFPLGRIWDPTLLDRLQLPLTRRLE